MCKKGRQITISEMAPHVHSFARNENKAEKIALWLEKWIKDSLNNGTIKPCDFLPLKGDMAFHIGVSLGTIQSAYRKVEDKGLIESKQKIGSYIKDKNFDTLKLTSKSEAACEVIKLHIKSNKYKIGEKLLSIRKLSEITGIPATTVRISLTKLTDIGILQKSNNNYVIKRLKYNVQNKQKQSLADKIAEKIYDSVINTSNDNTRLPSSVVLADMYNVSVKTVHDALKILSDAGFIKSNRGYYGTIVTRDRESDIVYLYEQVKIKLYDYIAKNCKINDKLPSIANFAEIFNVSKKTIKNSLDILVEEGYVICRQGRNGGTFVIEVPSVEHGYTWLALSSDYQQEN